MSSRLVYSTDMGRMCPKCEKPVADCSCKKKKMAATKTSSPGYPNHTKALTKAVFVG